MASLAVDGHRGVGEGCWHGALGFRSAWDAAKDRGRSVEGCLLRTSGVNPAALREVCCGGEVLQNRPQVVWIKWPFCG
jgi:hypothetical protein